MKYDKIIYEIFSKTLPIRISFTGISTVALISYKENDYFYFVDNSRSPLAALEYAMDNGIDTEATYPYKGKVNQILVLLK